MDPSFGPTINSKLAPILERLKTRKANKNQRSANRNTVKKVRNLLSKIKDTSPVFLRRKEWISKLEREMEERHEKNVMNNLEAAFHAAEAKPSAAKASNAKPNEAKPNEAKPNEAKPNEAKVKVKPRLKAPAEPKEAPAKPKEAPAEPKEAPAKPKEAPANGKFPRLFTKSKAEKTQFWEVEVLRQGQAALIRVSYGYQGGSTVANEKEITKGKNIGRKNETTPYEQALLDAKSAWDKKVTDGYAESVEKAQVPSMVSNSAIAAHETISPMLAQDYHKQGKKIVFPCYVQAKLDGVRSIFHKGVLTSRNGKGFSGLEHILAELAPATKEGLILDGEVYSTTLSFQQFVGLVKKKKFTAEDKEQLKNVNLWVYDCVNNKPFEQRLETLKEFFGKHKFTHVHLLPTEECAAREDLKGFHDKYVKEGNEGLIVRNKQGMYQLGARSYDLQKYKEFEDAEYEVAGFTEGQGLEEGLVIWICKTAKGQTFNVRPRGTHEDRAALFKVAKNYVGKQLTVRYQELTEDGIPRFPVGISFRDYE